MSFYDLEKKHDYKNMIHSLPDLAALPVNSERRLPKKIWIDYPKAHRETVRRLKQSTCDTAARD